MSKYLENYLDGLKNADLAQSVQQTVNGFLDKLAQGNYKQKIRNTLLLGNVQSGKTAQVLGVISALADTQNFRFFLYLTTDSVDLQQQTLQRTQYSLTDFQILAENDLHQFNTYFRGKKPIIAVIKKNSSVLRKWRNTLQSAQYLNGHHLVLIDDEADAASLNTKINKNGTSTINRLLEDIKNCGCQSLFIEVTATPQAVLLQNEQSDWQPEFIQYFEPGDNYIGGKFVFAEPTSYITRFIDEELEEIQDDSAEISEGLCRSLNIFLLTCTEFDLNGKQNCNFAIHPSHRIQDHQAFAHKLETHLNQLVFAINSGEDLSQEFQDAWEDLQQTKPNIHHFEDIFQRLQELLEQQLFKVWVFNSKSTDNPKLDIGFNILVGGNVIGRGLTIPKLQTVYYSRMSKQPNADTFWQHSRIFGYDRERDLLRMFIPHEIYKFFVQLNCANDLLIEQVKNGNERIQIAYPKGIKPTRQNVLHSNSLCLIAGGVNYFPDYPDENNLNDIQSLVNYIQTLPSESPDLYQINTDTLLQLVKSLGDYQESDWQKEKFISCIQALHYKRPSFKNYVLIKTGRKISKGTGTMLSPPDQDVGKSKSNDLILTLYRVTGDVKQKWQGQPFWLPNIKFPKGWVYWDTSD